MSTDLYRTHQNHKTGQGPVIPLNNIQMYHSKDCTKHRLRTIEHSKMAEYSPKHADQQICSLYLRGMKTQPPKKGGQYEICTEYVKHGT